MGLIFHQRKCAWVRFSEEDSPSLCEGSSSPELPGLAEGPQQVIPHVRSCVPVEKCCGRAKYYHIGPGYTCSSFKQFLSQHPSVGSCSPRVCLYPTAPGYCYLRSLDSHCVYQSCCCLWSSDATVSPWAVELHSQEHELFGKRMGTFSSCSPGSWDEVVLTCSHLTWHHSKIPHRR